MDSPSATTTSPKFPSYEAAYEEACSRWEEADCPVISNSVRRLRWSLDGPLTTSISVMAHHWINPTLPPDEPYYQPVPSGGANSSGNWHPVSQDALMEPKISSVAIDVGDLVNWEENWLEAHKNHYCPDFPEWTSTLTRIGPLPDADPNDPDEGFEEVDGEGTGHLLMCCGVERPRKTSSRFNFVVEAKGEGGFLTVHDYVEQLHGWLMGLREEILEATAIARAILSENPFSREEKLMLRAYGKDVDFLKEKEWTLGHRQPFEGCP